MIKTRQKNPVKARLAKKRKSFSVTYELNGKTITRSVGKDLDIISRIEKELTQLRDDNPRAKEVIVDNYLPRSLEIHFENTTIIGKSEGSEDIQVEESIAKEIAQLSNATQEYILQLATERNNFKVKADMADALKKELTNLKRSAEGQRAKAYIDAQPIDLEFKDYIAWRKFKKHGATCIEESKAIQENIISHFTSEVTLDLTAEEITAALRKRHNGYEDDKGHHHKGYEGNCPETAWNKSRRLIAAFVNWSFTKAEMTSPMRKVDTMKEPQKEIHFHRFKEIKDAINNIDSIFWKTIVGVYAYQGLRRNELIGLRIQDVDTKNWTISITPHNDGYTDHRLKRGWTKRKVKCCDLLIDLLQAYIASDGPGEYYFFPAPFPVLEKFGRHPEAMNGQYITKSLAGITPKKMTCASLRRTCGSFIVKSTKSYSVASKILGNTVETVETHYACIITEEEDFQIGE